MKHVGLKSLSFIIALILYFFVYSQNSSLERTLFLPIEFSNLPEDKFVLLPTDRQAKVTLRGPSLQLTAAMNSNLEFNVELPKSLDNNYEVVLNRNNLNLPDQIQVYNISPSKFELVLDDIISKN